MKILLMWLLFPLMLLPQSKIILGAAVEEEETGFTITDVPDLELWLKAGAATIPSWADISGNSRDLTTTNSPTLGSIDGLATMIFNGTNEYGKTPAFAQAHPFTIYIVMKQLSWTASDRIYDGNTSFKANINQIDASPKINSHSGGGSVLGTSNFTLNTWGIIRVKYNGASSNFWIDGVADTSGALGGNATDGFTLAARGDNTYQSNIEAAEVIIIGHLVAVTEHTQIVADLKKRMPSLP